jgi:hypothetical protein
LNRLKKPSLPERQLALINYKKMWRAGRLLSSSVARVVIADIISPSITAKKWRATPTLDVIRSIASWLKLAHTNGMDGGISNGYYLLRGWLAPHVETNGYTIPTLLQAATILGEKEYATVAIHMAEWELRQQLPNGAFPSIKGKNLAFDTAQILQGLLSAYRHTSNHDFLEAAVKAGDWLVSNQEADGSWVRVSFWERPHAYHTRVAWSLLQLFELVNKPIYQDAAIRNIEWVCRQQHPDAWLPFCEFREGSAALTHTIGYALEGLIECSRLLPRPMCDVVLQKAIAIANRLLSIWNNSRFMSAELSAGWEIASRYSCLTGNAQIALSWLKLFTLTGDKSFYEAAVNLNALTCATVYINRGPEHLRGAVKSSQPIYAPYLPLNYPIWAAKFLLDSLMEQWQLSRNIA